MCYITEKYINNSTFCHKQAHSLVQENIVWMGGAETFRAVFLLYITSKDIIRD